ncbi:carbohydrate ABC transporter permease [Euzebya tangerina]|uniref:carbohydrate ABC transporter permease n=1 Tax=Euzebya tangerina TaxID=591198 RepID=UPI000E320AD1|nr:carbohydrate ABC transporter permease [Euzebya tangerina]
MRRRGSLALSAVMLALAAFSLFPLLIALAGAFKDDAFVFAEAGSLRSVIPEPFVGLENFRDVERRTDLFRPFANSVIITTSIVVVGAVVNSLFGYALARLRFRGRTLLVALIASLIIIPFEALAIPLLLLFAEIDWLDSYRVQILPFIANPFFIYLFYTFFLDMPVELEEAAKVDGAGPVRVFVSVIAPLARPAYATAAILTFLFSWGQLLWPTIVTRSAEVRPLPLGLAVFQTSPPVQWGDIMAFVSLMTIPTVVIFISFQRHFVEGIASQGIKG